ncbi:MAG: hypothetical protein BWZ04_03253 [Firmicutes bacterium ADurb.BinA205]|nr:MAG: hypothetical protein BWZ04_03253 [Firmicutes bacterium ADurb.BinA205]
MAQFTYYPDQEFLKQLNKLADEKLIERVLKTGGSMMVPVLKANIRSAVKNSTGALEKSVKVSNVKTDREGNKCVYVLPTGKDKDGVTNMAKLAYIEYGVRKYNRAPKPLILRTIKDSQVNVEKAMQEKLEELI